MADAVTALSAALNNDMQAMRTVAQNLANISTNGYKREVAYAGSFDQVLAQPLERGGSEALALAQAPVLSTVIDMQQGALKFTGSAFDVSLQGDGFLTVETTEGVRYTRQGNMQIDSQGRLALEGQGAVLGESGAIYLRSGPFEIDSTGLVRQEGVDLDRLNLVDFENPAALDYQGAGLFAEGRSGGLVKGDFEGQVMQGYIETSNVKSMDEIVKMVEITRHFQTTHKVLQGYDGMLDKAINVLGDL